MSSQTPADSTNSIENYEKLIRERDELNVRGRQETQLKVVSDVQLRLDRSLQTVRQSLDCRKCHGLLFQPYGLVCEHSVCARCLVELKEESNPPRCPKCYTEILLPPIFSPHLHAMAVSYAAYKGDPIPPPVEFIWPEPKPELIEKGIKRYADEKR
ncbi:hypothetical protein E1B28_002257 [Marasmius oreades]|uniref:RING-type domain-containing protein n=1 Tax=Marasmius oreades TaxID=181124 RepID=A0A9P7RNS1_9AGAR|nr:uncharacterized protein E1B28_002257 [Marasmius oreades]KAG7086293.1 hypothetical protein E1B28_002257 [Marasmius oreades]